MPQQWIQPNAEEVRQAVEVAITDLEVAERDSAAEESEGTYGRLLRAEFWGTRAATRKRLAEVQFLYSTGDWRRTLRAAVRDYQRGMEQGVKVDHWVLGQYVVLSCVLDELSEFDLTRRAARPDGESFVFSWAEARRSVMGALHSDKPDAKMWAYSSMADLLMVAQGTRAPLTELDGQLLHATAEDVLQQLRNMIEVVGGPDQCPAIWPTFRQFWRWHVWWKSAAWEPAAEQGYAYLWSFVRPRLERG